MKKVKTYLVAMLFMLATLFQTGCIGSFQMTNQLYDWNQGLNSKALQELVFVGFVILPVYAVTLFIDGLILNSIEFWSGSNPMAMEAGDLEEQIVQNEGTSYRITATKNKFHVEQLNGDLAGQHYDLVYVPDEHTWYIHANGMKQRIAELSQGEPAVKLFKPNGESIRIDRSVASRNAVKAAVNLELQQLTLFK